MRPLRTFLARRMFTTPPLGRHGSEFIVYNRRPVRLSNRRAKWLNRTAERCRFVPFPAASSRRTQSCSPAKSLGNVAGALTRNSTHRLIAPPGADEAVAARCRPRARGRAVGGRDAAPRHTCSRPARKRFTAALLAPLAPTTLGGRPTSGGALQPWAAKRPKIGCR